MPNTRKVSPCKWRWDGKSRQLSKKLPRSLFYPKNRIKALVLEHIDENAITQLKNEGYNVEILAKSVEKQILEKQIEDVSLLGIRSRTHITKKVLARAQRLLAIGAFCIGIDQIDIPACTQRGIALFNAPFSNTRSVVELVMGEMIMLVRRISEKNIACHAGKWWKSAEGCFELRGKKLGIVGYGNIGSQLSVLAEALGMDVYFYDLLERPIPGNARRCRSLKHVLKIADFVSVHVDGRPGNRLLFGEKNFAVMKEGFPFPHCYRG